MLPISLEGTPSTQVANRKFLLSFTPTLVTKSYCVCFLKMSQIHSVPCNPIVAFLVHPQPWVPDLSLIVSCRSFPYSQSDLSDFTLYPLLALPYPWMKFTYFAMAYKTCCVVLPTPSLSPPELF